MVTLHKLLPKSGATVVLKQVAVQLLHAYFVLEVPAAPDPPHWGAFVEQVASIYSSAAAARVDVVLIVDDHASSAVQAVRKLWDTTAQAVSQVGGAAAHGLVLLSVCDNSGRMVLDASTTLGPGLIVEPFIVHERDFGAIARGLMVCAERARITAVEQAICEFREQVGMERGVDPAAQQVALLAMAAYQGMHSGLVTELQLMTDRLRNARDMKATTQFRWLEVLACLCLFGGRHQTLPLDPGAPNADFMLRNLMLCDEPLLQLVLTQDVGTPADGLLHVGVQHFMFAAIILETLGSG